MICMLGKTASGKSEIVKKMVDEYGFKKIVTYTTRPIRKGEKDGDDYHFITEEAFKEKIDEGFFAEYKTYDTAYGKWYYGTPLKTIQRAGKKAVLIVTPDGYRDLIDELDYRPRSIYINANLATINQRLKGRRQKVEEKKRRIKQDNIDFKNVYTLVDKIVYNNAEDDIEDVVKKVVAYGMDE